MSNFKRYGLSVNHIDGKMLKQDGEYIQMVECSDGAYVRFDDINELLNTAHNKQIMPFISCVHCVHLCQDTLNCKLSVCVNRPK